MKKITASVLAIIVLSFCFMGGCSEKYERKKLVFGTVSIIGPNGEMILDSEIYVKKRGAVASDAVKAACAEVRLAFTYENGMFDNFDGIASGQDEGWLFYESGELASEGAGSYEIGEAFEIEFKYENYAESFNLN